MLIVELSIPRLWDVGILFLGPRFVSYVSFPLRPAVP
jgi:hypothetical protein